MQARRAARELALILFSQLDKKITNYSKSDFNDIILKSVRILTSNATEELKLTLGSLIDTQEYLDNYEMDHEMNLKRPIEAKNLSVPIPTTGEMKNRIDEMIEISEKALLALEIAEFTTLENSHEVKDYTVKIAEQFKNNADIVDENIQKFSKGWDIARLVKMDKDILRIAITELLFIKSVPMKVVVDEALELAKKYSTEESSSFVNGILAKVIIENGVS